MKNCCKKLNSIIDNLVCPNSIIVQSGGMSLVTLLSDIVKISFLKSKRVTFFN